MEPIDNAEAADGQRSTGSSYSPDGKLKRYNGILQEFMAYYLGREQFPADHVYSEAELSSIQPHDIVNWMNVKAFGTEEPDYRDPSVSGSHHTLAFWRKGLGYYMPAGQVDWDPVGKTGNPSRSQEVRDLISMVKALNDDGTLLPRKQPNNAKREGEDGGGGRKKRARKSNPASRAGPGAPQNAPTPIVMSAEFNDLLRQIHAQKTSFLQSLEQLNAAVNKMKNDVDSSYTVMIGQLASLGSKATVASSEATDAGVPTIPAPLIARSHTLFTVWSVQGGKLSPVPADWSFPKALTAKEAIYMWFNGEPSSHTPPLQYLTTGHLKHLKGAAASHGGVRRFMKLVRYLGLKNHFWLENWDKARVDALWSKIWPEIELAVGDHLSEDTDDGAIKCGTLFNTISKNSNLMKEVAENLEIQTEAYAAEVIAATEEALGGNVGVGSENASKEMMWGIHHGKLNPFPSDWQFPTNVDAATVLGMWFLGDPGTGIPPLRYVHSTYVSFLKCGAGYISKLRCVMKVVKHQAIQLGCWSEDNWSEDTVAALWAQVWEAINPKLKHQTATSTVSWQALYNKMHESGMISALKAGDNEEEQDDGDQPTEV
ncbi:hypothetical protein ACHAXT_000801 [Thalassiosira profunda]